MYKLSKTRKPGPERWIVAFAFPTLDRNNYFFWTQDTRYKIQGLSQHPIHHWYVTNTWPMVYQCIADTLSILSQPTVDQWLTDDLSICLSILDQYKTNTRLMRNRSSTTLNRNIDQVVDRHSANMLIDMLSKTQPICWRIHWSTPVIRHKIHIKYKTKY